MKSWLDGYFENTVSKACTFQLKIFLSIMDINRREFLSYSAVTGTTILFSEIAAYAKPLKSLIAPGFELLVLATNWGFDGTWDQFCS